jgi:hypothetical protein
LIQLQKECPKLRWMMATKKNESEEGRKEKKKEKRR